jgi:2'-5' RNA ligase
MAGYDEITEKNLASIQNELYNVGFVGTHTKNLPQHITLGTFPLEKEAEIKTLIKRIAEVTESFDITFNHIGIFGGSNVLFIAPDPNVRLLNLKEYFGDSYDWTPHSTMLIDEPNKVFDALPIVANKFSAFQGKVENIHLYEFGPTRHILSLNFPK